MILNNSTLENGFKQLKKELIFKKIELSKFEYFYVSIWCLACQPCINQILFLDVYTEKFNKKIIPLMISSHSDAAIITSLKNKNICTKNLIFLNKMNDLISGIYKEIGVKNQAFPLHVVLDKKGNCLAYLFGAFHDEGSAAPLMNFIDNLD